MSTVTTLRFSALDTLFFRESRPFDAIGGSELSSVFPPPPRTILGAVRTGIGDALGANWEQFQYDADYTLNGIKLRDLIGYGDGLGALSLKGAWPSQNERLYPAPLFLLHRENQTKPSDRLLIGGAVKTGIGNVRLPELPAMKKGLKPLESAWLTRSGMEKVLSGGLPAEGELFEQHSFFAEEPRLGIARDNIRRTAKTGFLYQTRHLRPKTGVAIEADIAGLDNINLENKIVRLGGEGRLAEITAAPASALPVKPLVNNDTARELIIVLLTPGRFENEHGGWLPSTFSPEQAASGNTVWKGTINGVRLTIHSAVLGKVQREGGWDMAEGKPRAVESLVPAGSSYYCTVDDKNIGAAIDALHGIQIGQDHELGRGIIACGLCTPSEFSTEHPGGKA